MVYTINQICELIEPLVKQHGINKVYLFGSYARGEADEESDVDLAIEMIDDYYFFDAYSDLKAKFDNHADILLVSILLAPKTHTAQLVKDNFLKERTLIYEKSIA